MTRDGCYRHPHVEASHVAMVKHSAGRSVYRVCAVCAADFENVTALPGRVDIPIRKDH